MSLLSRFDFSVDPGQQLDAEIQLPDDDRGVIHGVVVDKDHRPVKDAVVKLFERKRHTKEEDEDQDQDEDQDEDEDEGNDDQDEDDDDDQDEDGEKKNCDLEPITHTFTDACGQFLFGPLCPDRKYAVKIWHNDVCIRKEQIEISPQGGCLHASLCGKD